LIKLRTLTDGGQEPMEIARELAAFLGEARQTLELALYDIRLPDEVGDVVRGALEDAAGRGVSVRLAYNVDHGHRKIVPPPPKTVPEIVESIPVPTKAIPGVPDLMHHKYVIRDGTSLWSGSTNWTIDSWSREENVIVTVDSPAVAAAFIEDFEQLWTKTDVEKSGKVPPNPVRVDGRKVRAWFCPGYGAALTHKIGHAIGRAKERVRIASPVITSGPIIGTLAEVAADGKIDLAGVVDVIQIEAVLHQWAMNPPSSWKIPVLQHALTLAPFSGKRSTPYGPGTVHDYMHAKMVVADDVLFVGSFNLSHSGEMNAENVLEIADADLAAQAATYIDEVRARYPLVDLAPSSLSASRAAP
jgi:phosphatidylserine/phosphatidylglycerophosphate/cardiolipin synthase-like enzyme